jgi:hypothetical protein
MSRLLPRHLLASPALAVLVTLIAPAAFAHGAGKDFLSLQAWGTPSQDEFRTMARAGVRTFRANLIWNQVESARGTRNWGAMDGTVERAARAGIRIFPVLIGSPSYASRAPRGLSYPETAGGRRAYAAFLADAVRRYGRSGAFWRDRPGLPYRPVAAWQIWNEPNLRLFSSGRPNARRYAALLKASHRTIKRVDPRAAIVLAGLPPARLGVAPLRYLSSLYRIRGIKRYFDVAAVHPYAKNESRVVASVRGFGTVMRRYRDSRTRVWVTEVGWATGGPRNIFRTTERLQASRLDSLVRRLRRRSRGMPSIGRIIWFTFRDRALKVGERDWWAPHTGLFDRQGRAKPAWRVFARHAKGS